MRLTTRHKIGAGFAAAFLIVVVGLLSLRSERRALDAARWVAHTHEVLAGLDAMLGALVDVETGQRGYVITGEPRYLEPYDAGRLRVASEVARVRRLTADDPRQQARLDGLAPVIDARLAMAERVVQARRTGGGAAAAALVAGNEGKRLMDDVRARVSDMRRDERALLDRRTMARAESERRSGLVTLIGAIGAFALVVLMLRVIQQDVALQERTARERDALLASEQAARARLAAIQRVTDAALAPLALDDLLTELMTRLREVLAADTACVHLVMRDGATLELCKCVGPTAELSDRVRVPVGRGVVGGIAARAEPLAVDRLGEVEVFDPVLRERFASFLGAPLMVPAVAVAGGAVGSSGHRVIGVVHVETTEPRHFTDDEVALLTLVAERAASAIERARLYQSERRGEERFRLLVDGVVDYAIYMLDPQGRVVSWNAGAERLKGYTASEILGESFARFYTDEDRARGLPDRALAAAEAEEHCRGAGWRVRRDGSRFWADVSITALRDEDDGGLVGFAKVTRDLTERKRADEAMVAARDAAEAANAAKTQFLATMSHEIRTPINAVLGYTDLLDMGLDGPVTEGQRARLARVRASGRHLLGLVNELLDLAKIEADQLRVERVSASASEAAGTALALVYPQANARGLSVVNRCVGPADARYVGDPHRVEQVLTNLVSNAVKFTPPGGRVDVECGLTETPSETARLARAEGDHPTCWCYVRVTDTGPGIDPELRDAVFDPFVQGNGNGSPYTREHGGTGLGLAISRRLARLMGGDVTLESEPGRGSTFTLWLAAAVEVRGEGAGALDGCRTAERRAPTRQAAGLARAGHAMRDRATTILATHVHRLRTELDAPGVAALPDAELEDHIGTLLAEIARALVLIDQAGGEASRAVRDGADIQRVLAERHGAQRAALGWTEAHHRRELEMLHEDIASALRAALGGRDDADVDAALDVVRQLLAHVERAGERARRNAPAS